MTAFGSEVSADFFITLGARLLAGRAFTAAEQNSATAGVVITEAAASALFDAPHTIPAAG